MSRAKNQIDPFDKKHWGAEQNLWCIFGHDSFPTLIACRILEHAQGPVIWGYSVYKRQPGFRTLGTSLENFLKRPAKFFATQAHALEHLEKITTPRRV